jgi:hypothetical protein
MTTSIRAYSTDIGSATGNALSTSRSVLISMSIKVASANALVIGFRDSKRLSDSHADYFGRIAIGITNDGSEASIQLKIGNEVIPYCPVTELFFQLQGAMHEFGDKHYDTMFMKIDDDKTITADTT